MDKNETKQAIEVMQAWVDGADIECAGLTVDDWAPIMNPSDPKWTWGSLRYRIKPEPREFWLAYAQVGTGIYSSAAPYRSENQTIGLPDCPVEKSAIELIRVREVIE